MLQNERPLIAACSIKPASFLAAGISEDEHNSNTVSLLADIIWKPLVMVVHKVCLRRRGKTRKIHSAGSMEAERGLGSVSLGSSDSLFQRVKLD